MELHYFELEEQLSEEEKLYKKPIIVRLAVTDRADARVKLGEFEKAFSGSIAELSVKKIHEIHRHDPEGDNQPCTIEDLSLTDEQLDGVEIGEIQK